jgi:hypothetical protein
MAKRIKTLLGNAIRLAQCMRFRLVASNGTNGSLEQVAMDLAPQQQTAAKSIRDFNADSNTLRHCRQSAFRSAVQQRTPNT